MATREEPIMGASGARKMGRPFGAHFPMGATFSPRADKPQSLASEGVVTRSDLL